MRVAWAGVGLGTCPRSCERWLCRCMRRAQGSAGAASSRAPSAGITASDSDPSVRRRPPPLLRDASVPHTHPGIRMVAKASFRVAVRCHEAALRCGPVNSSCNCLVRADPCRPAGNHLPRAARGGGARGRSAAKSRRECIGKAAAGAFRPSKRAPHLGKFGAILAHFIAGTPPSVSSEVPTMLPGAGAATALLCCCCTETRWWRSVRVYRQH